jgi:type I restriction-modification system DNA methylase subunit
MRLLLLKGENINLDIKCHNSLGRKNFNSLDGRQFDCAVSHSTFLGAEHLPNVLDTYLEFKTDRLENLMLTHVLDLLKPGGFIVALIPGRVIQDNTDEYKAYRDYVFTKYTIRALVSLPKNIVPGYPNSTSYLLVVQNKKTYRGEGSHIFFHSIEEDSNDRWEG